MSDDLRQLVERLTRPIIGAEYRTSDEVFDIMCDRIRGALATSALPMLLDRADDGWRPIATWEGRPNGEAHSVILCVDEGPERAPSVGEAYYDPDAYDGTWWWAGTRFGNWGDSPLCDTQLGQPTHWRPLPTPPATDPIR